MHAQLRIYEADDVWSVCQATSEQSGELWVVCVCLYSGAQ